MANVLADLALESEAATAAAMRLARAFDAPTGGDEHEQRLKRARHRRHQVLDVQARTAARGRGARVPRRHGLRRGVRTSPAVPPEPAQRHLGGIGQRHLPRRAARHRPRAGVARRLLGRGRASPAAPTAASTRRRERCARSCADLDGIEARARRLVERMALVLPGARCSCATPRRRSPTPSARRASPATAAAPSAPCRPASTSPPSSPGPVRPSAELHRACPAMPSARSASCMRPRPSACATSVAGPTRGSPATVTSAASPSNRASPCGPWRTHGGHDPTRWWTRSTSATGWCWARGVRFGTSPDGYIYVKEEVGGLLMGGFEPHAKPWAMDGIPENFEFGILPDDWDQFQILMENALIRLPALETAEIKTFMNGPESFTPDNNFILGEAPELKNFFVGAGFNSSASLPGGGRGKGACGMDRARRADARSLAAFATDCACHSVANQQPPAWFPAPPQDLWNVRCGCTGHDQRPRSISRGRSSAGAPTGADRSSSSSSRGAAPGRPSHPV